MPEGLRRRAFLGALSALALSSIPARAEARLSLEEVAACLRRCSPLGTYILERSAAGARVVPQASGEVRFGRFDAGAFVRNRPPGKLVEAASIAVHEASHYLASILAAQSDAEATVHPGSVGLVVAPDRIRYLRGQPCFPSREAAASFPPFLRQGPRFETYVTSADPYLVTQQYGVFGLLNEFAAYHAGSRTALDVARDLARRPTGQAREWVIHLSDADSTLLAWAEFRGYILAWLAFARWRHPQVYKELLGSPALRAAWNDLDRAYGKACRAWYRDLPALIETLQRSGIEIQARQGALLAAEGQVLRGRRLLQQQDEIGQARPVALA